MNLGLKTYHEKIKAGLIERSFRQKRPSMKKAILAKCKDCMCDYIDGRLDCEIEDCSLYFWMPYGKLRKKDKCLATV